MFKGMFNEKEETIGFFVFFSRKDVIKKKRPNYLIKFYLIIR